MKNHDSPLRHAVLVVAAMVLTVIAARYGIPAILDHYHIR